MLDQHINVLSLLKRVGEITGRKKFQKIVFISKKLGMPFHEKYNFHRYGPYSEELSLRLEELQQFGFISEIKEEKAGYHQYRYQVAANGEDFLNTKGNDRETFEQQKTVIEDMNACSSKFLELASTILFLEPADKEEIIKKVHTLKKTQKYSKQDIEQAYAHIEYWRQHLNKGR
ncbi:YwgA family protein [Salicibibacter halophilus]|uniref:YwgA family protein n=1 Tax=Salicibibacter halophilus TaxID=2502791 RepID=A0A514LJJ7_9BACI|nr:YwgA family protein [Salicibibacter halophilus]QDI91695.1 YwgA family protein [Salicibibacter halophilus]